MNWITKFNRQYLLYIGIISALIGTFGCTIFVALAMEIKSCLSDEWNYDVVPWRWNYKNWSWLNFLATMLGGLIGQGIQLIVIHTIGLI